MRFTTVLKIGLFALMSSANLSAATGIPPHDDGALELKTLVYVLDLQSINSASQSYTGNILYRVRWHDPRLAHDGPGNRRVELKNIWHPSIQVLNRQRVFTTFPEEAQVSPSGMVTLRQRMWGEFTQALDLHEFPFDNQQFDFTLAAIGQTTDEVVFTDDDELESQLAEERTLPDWQVSAWESQGLGFNPVPGSDLSVPTYRFSFFAKRNMAFYIYKVILPLLLLAAMSWLVFWINIEESSVQVNVSITTILTLIAYRFAIGSSLPAVSYMTRMDRMILGATVLAFAALALVVVVQSLRRSDRLDAAVRVQQLCRIVFPVLLLLGVYRWLIL